MSEPLTAERVIELPELKPHPRYGMVAETYRAHQHIPDEALTTARLRCRVDAEAVDAEGNWTRCQFIACRSARKSIACRSAGCDQATRMRIIPSVIAVLSSCAVLETLIFFIMLAR